MKTRTTIMRTILSQAWACQVDQDLHWAYTTTLEAMARHHSPSSFRIWRPFLATVVLNMTIPAAQLRLRQQRVITGLLLLYPRWGAFRTRAQDQSTRGNESVVRCSLWTRLLTHPSRILILTCGRITATRRRRRLDARVFITSVLIVPPDAL